VFNFGQENTSSTMCRLCVAHEYLQRFHSITVI